MGTLHEGLCTFMIIYRLIIFRVRNISDERYREDQNTHFMFSNFPRKSCRLRDNVEKYGKARQAKSENLIRLMRCVCWITNATDPYSECYTNCFSTVTIVTLMCSSVSLILASPSESSLDRVQPLLRWVSGAVLSPRAKLSNRKAVHSLYLVSRVKGCV